MRKKTLLAVAIVALLISATVTVPIPAAAQSGEQAAASGPPQVMQLFVEDVKPGRAPAHLKNEAAWTAAYKKAMLKDYYVGATTLSGPPQAWFFAAFGSMGDVERVNAALEANKAVQAQLDRVGAAESDLLSNTRSMFVFYNKELSYRPDFNIGNYKYVMVDTVRVKPGQFSKFAEMWKMVNAAHEKANMDEHMLVYNAGLGAPGGTVFVFQPLKSLKEWDQMGKTHGKGSGYYEAVGDEGRKKMGEFAQNDQKFFERNILAISPEMSFVSEKVMAANPSFWMPKAAMAKSKSHASKGVKPVAERDTTKIRRK